MQIGIGSFGDAIARCLIVRHERPERHAALLKKLPIQHDYLTRESGRFERGLYGCSEMVVDGLIQLIDAGILIRRVFPSLDLEQRHHAGEAVPGGVILHGGFFLGSRAMYERLKAMPADQSALIDMTRISFVNQLYGQEELTGARGQRSFRPFDQQTRRRCACSLGCSSTSRKTSESVSTSASYGTRSYRPGAKRRADEREAAAQQRKAYLDLHLRAELYDLVRGNAEECGWALGVA
ncbi:MAG: hypothetical protein WCF10_19325 [Polyangiales bacterium]